MPKLDYFPSFADIIEYGLTPQELSYLRLKRRSGLSWSAEIAIYRFSDNKEIRAAYRKLFETK